MEKFTITKACELAEISRPTFYKYINNGLISVVKDGKSTFIELSELLRVFPNIKLHKNDSNSVTNLHELTQTINHQNEIITLLKQQLNNSEKENLFLQNQLTQLNQNFTSINKILESKNSKRKKFLGIF